MNFPLNMVPLPEDILIFAGVLCILVIFGIPIVAGESIVNFVRYNDGQLSEISFRKLMVGRLIFLKFPIFGPIFVGSIYDIVTYMAGFH